MKPSAFVCVIVLVLIYLAMSYVPKSEETPRRNSELAGCKLVEKGVIIPVGLGAYRRDKYVCDGGVVWWR